MRRLTGTPYRRARSSTGSIPGSTKVKPHHTVYISGDPETHPDVLKNEVVGALHLPVEYTEHFEVKGGVNSARLLRATRKAILEIVSNGVMGASALSEESWRLTICGPKKQGHYNVEIEYYATATRTSCVDTFPPAAIEKAKNIPGLMTIEKRRSE